MTTEDAIAAGQRASVVRVNNLLADLRVLDHVCGAQALTFRHRVRELSRLNEIVAHDGDYTHAFLLWQNDSVLGVYATKSTAMRAALQARKKLGGKWSGKNPRWYQKEGPVARLEIDQRPLRAELRSYTKLEALMRLGG